MIAGVDAASLAVAISCAFAAWMVVEMLFLLQHRRAAERREAADRVTAVAVTRDLLAAIEDEAGERPLRAFDRASSAERLRAARQLIQLVRGDDRDRLLAIGERARLFDATLHQLASTVEVRRIEAVRELELFGSASCIAGLERCLATDRSRLVRLEAAVALSQLGHLPGARQLIAALDLGGEPLTRMHAGLFRSIAMRDGDALVALTLDGAFARQRAMLVDALGWTASFAVLPVLEEHGRDRNSEVRCSALRAARRIGHPAASPWIATLLLDPCEDVRIQAVQACGALGLRETVPILLSLAQQPSWWVRTRALEALDKLKVGGPAGDARLATAA